MLSVTADDVFKVGVEKGRSMSTGGGVGIVDYEADGQPDMRINFKDHYFEIWHVDRWYLAEARDGRRGIVVDGEFVELQRGENRWIVP
jgi:hypothetical protein